jgi:hypothetical protein
VVFAWAGYLMPVWMKKYVNMRILHMVKRLRFSTWMGIPHANILHPLGAQKLKQVFM